MKTTKNFPNSFESWAETHYEISNAINTASKQWGTKAYIVEMQTGTCGLYELSVTLTNKFENAFKGVNWGEENDWFDEIENFINENIY